MTLDKILDRVEQQWDEWTTEMLVKTYEQISRWLDRLYPRIVDRIKPIVQPYARLHGYERWPLSNFEINFEIDGDDIIITPVPNRAIGFMPIFRVPKSYVYATDEMRQGMLDAWQRQKDGEQRRIDAIIERSERESLRRLIEKYGVPDDI